MDIVAIYIYMYVCMYVCMYTCALIVNLCHFTYCSLHLFCILETLHKKTPIKLELCTCRYCTCFLSVHSKTLNANILRYNVHNHVIPSSSLPFELQRRMSVCKVVITVMIMQLVMTIIGVILALAKLDSEAMELLARVSHSFTAYLFF